MTPPPTSASAMNSAPMNSSATSRKRERWLVTRKTWQYMADAGKLLIPEALRKGKDTRDYSTADFRELDDHYQQVCNNLQEFVLWEGPALDPRITIAKNRLAEGISVLVQSLGNIHQERLDAEQTSVRSSSECETPPTDKQGVKKKKKAAKSKSKTQNAAPIAPIAAIKRKTSTTQQQQKTPLLGPFAHQQQNVGQNQSQIGHYQAGLDRVRVMLPAGEKPPEGYVEVGRRVLPMGAIGPPTDPPSEESLIHLPSGMVLQELPAVYANAEDREWYNSRRSSSTTTRPESSVTSPVNSNPPDDLELINPAGDAGAAKPLLRRRRGKRSVLTQTEPMPPELEQLLLEEQRRREEEQLRLALEEEEKILREKQLLESAHMGDQVMRYLHLVRRNSKSSDQKKADRFRSMNYDPTLRNIKSKYMMKESLLEGTKHMEIQIGESLITILKKCHTPIDPTPDNKKRVFDGDSNPKTSPNIASNLNHVNLWDTSTTSSANTNTSPTTTTMSPARKRTAAFVRRLHDSEMPLEDEYFSYMNAWYEAQRGMSMTPISSNSTVPNSSKLPGLGMGGGDGHTGIYIPVSVLQNLRNSLPIVVASNAEETGATKKSTKKTTAASTKLLQSVRASKPFTANTVNAAKKLPKLWRTASSGSAIKANNNNIAGNNNNALWTPKDVCRWQHSMTTRELVLESSHVMLLSEAERVPLRKLAVDKLNQAPLMGPNATIRIPKEPSEAPKGRRRGLLGRRKTGANAPRKNDNKENKRTSLTSGSSSGLLCAPHPLPMFGVPLHLCLEAAGSSPSSRKRSSVHSMVNTSDDSLLLSPPPLPSLGRHRRGRSSESRSSFDSVHSAVATNKALLTPESRISSPPYSLGSTESLASVFFDSRPRRRSSVAGAASSSSGINLDSVSCHSYLERAAAGNEEDLAVALAQSGLNVPPLVVMCVRHLEQNALRTTGIFRVSASKKRVRQLRDDLDSGQIVVLPEDANVHDVAALLKEFLRDLPEPLFPKELLPALLATQKLGDVEQLGCVQHLMQLLAPAHRDTLFVLLHFLALVTEHAEDTTLADGTVVEPGNRMDATNLATLFAPNVFHALTDAGSGDEEQRNLQVSAMRMLIEQREHIFEISAQDLHDVYLYLHDHFPALLDGLLNKRAMNIDNAANAVMPDEEDELVENTEEVGTASATVPTSAPPCGAPMASLAYSSPPTQKPTSVFFDSSSSQTSSVFGSPTSAASQTKEVETLDDDFGSSSTLVLQPAPSKRSSEKLNWRAAPGAVGLADRRAAGAFRSKTDDLERLLTDLHDDSNDNAENNGSNTGNRGVRRYARRRYTDTRHPTAELADLSDVKK